MSVEYNNISKVMALIDGEIQSIIRDEPENMRNDIRGAMNSSGRSGRIYTRRSVTHQASAPGEAPAPDTGNLVASIVTRQTDAMHSAVQSDAVYSLALELGRPEVNLLPRPAWIPAKNTAVKRIRKRLKVLRKKVENV